MRPPAIQQAQAFLKQWSYLAAEAVCEQVFTGDRRFHVAAWL